MEQTRKYPLTDVLPIVKKLGYTPDRVNDVVGGIHESVKPEDASPNWWYLESNKGFFRLTVHDDGRSYLGLHIPVQEYFEIMPNGGNNLCDEYSINYWGTDGDVGCDDFNIFGDLSMVKKFEDSYLSTFKMFVETITTDYLAALNEIQQKRLS